MFTHSVHGKVEIYIYMWCERDLSVFDEVSFNSLLIKHFQHVSTVDDLRFVFLCLCQSIVSAYVSRVALTVSTQWHTITPNKHSE